MKKLTEKQNTALSTRTTSKEDLALYSPENCFRHSSKLKSIKDIFKYPSPTLGAFARKNGREWVIAYIEFWLLDLNHNANVKTSMSEAQIRFTAERVYDTYSLKITDLTLFFRNVKEGFYGPYYENLSQDKIMGWLKEYYDLRCEYAAMDQQQKHDGFSLYKDKMDPEVIKKMFEGVGEEKAEFDHEKNGMGNRFKNVLTEKLGKDRTAILKKIKAMTNAELKKYIATTDFSSDGFDPFFYRLAETEIDSRNKKQAK